MKEATSDNSILEILLDSLHKKMRDATSSYYLPNIVAGFNNPKLSPYTASGPWTLNGDLGDMNIKTASNQLCLQATPAPYLPATGIGSEGPIVKLENIKICGLNNVLPDSHAVTDPDSDAPKVTVYLSYCTIHDGKLPEVITITGNFNITQQCCIPDRSTGKCTSTGTKYSVDNGSGSFTTTLTPDANDNLLMICNATITVQANKDFLFTINDMSITAPENTINTHITINDSSQFKDAYEKLADDAFNSSGEYGAKQKIVTLINANLKRDNIKNQIGSKITELINQAFKEQK